MAEKKKELTPRTRGDRPDGTAFQKEFQEPPPHTRGSTGKKHDGTAFQKDFQEALVWIQEHEKAAWHRFVDSKAARNLVAEQPGDFMLLAKGTAHLFELKSTVDKVPLKEFLRTKIGMRQVAQARKWERGGGRAWFALCEKPPADGWVSIYALRDLTEDMNAKPRYTCELGGFRAMLWCLAESKIEFNRT